MSDPTTIDTEVAGLGVRLRAAIQRQRGHLYDADLAQAVRDERAATQPVTWCRVLRTGPVCPHPCASCKQADAVLDDETRARLLAAADADLRAALGGER